MSPPARIPSWEEMHYRLVSLWDFYMHEFKAGKFIEASNWLCKLSQQLVHGNWVGFLVADHKEMVEESDILLSEATALGFDLAVESIRKLRDIIRNNGVTQPDGTIRFSVPDVSKLKGLGDEVTGRISDHFKTRVALVIPSNQASLYEQTKPLFGATVDAKFKKRARREIEEAGKCLALDRNTACVFHLMRAIEVALEAIRTCLGIPPPTKGQHKAWGAALERIGEEIQGREKLTWPRQWSSMDDKKLFHQVNASLDAIKDAWRDSTMHVESDYNAREAAHIFALTKGFMQKVASRLDEDGQPLA